MNINSIPHSSFVATATDAEEIGLALGKVIHPNFHIFVSGEPIEGMPCSGRILFVEKAQGGVPFQKLLGAMDMGDQIHLLTEKARYAPATSSSARKGWEIRAAIVSGIPAAIVWATQVEKEKPSGFPPLEVLGLH